MTVTITPAPLHGEIRAIASKSAAHRLLICAALADAPTQIVCPDTSRDIEATVSCLSSLGAGIERRGASIFVSPIKSPVRNAALDCIESGSTLRFLLPVCCALGTGAQIRLHGRLPERPLSPLWEELMAHGAVLSRPERDTVAVSGKSSGKSWSIDGGVSSQFVSGILFALPILGGGRLEITGRTESAGYIDMTVSAMLKFGVDVKKTDTGYAVSGGYHTPGRAEVEGDWSNAAFWLAAGELCSGAVRCTGLDVHSGQGDRTAVDILPRLGGGAAVDARDIPDLVPILAVTAALKCGKTTFTNAGRLRIKESDRIKTTCALINALGGRASETPDGLTVDGMGTLRGGTVDSAGDHRIAMCAAIASIGCTEPVKVLGAECTQKSYPLFWQDFAKLGGQIKTED
jgi:3-phosphoshikimate 1-carboxyvinyltransferase